MAKGVNEAVREVCLSFPEAEEVISHGSPDFRVRGKTFASYVVNHHGDGRVALWLNAPTGSQDHYSRTEPKHFFVPPYVGPRGWLGVHLDKGISWQRVAALVRQAYEKVAPASLARSIGATVSVGSKVTALRPEEINPLTSPRARAILQQVRKLCLSWPEVSEGEQFGCPVWRAGKKTFLWMHVDRNASVGAAKSSRQRARPRLQLYFWVGVASQGLMSTAERFSIPPYIGHQGWIALDVTEKCGWDEVKGLAFSSYRHFALTRMLKELDTAVR